MAGMAAAATVAAAPVDAAHAVGRWGPPLSAEAAGARAGPPRHLQLASTTVAAATAVGTAPPLCRPLGGLPVVAAEATAANPTAAAAASTRAAVATFARHPSPREVGAVVHVREKGVHLQHPSAAVGHKRQPHYDGPARQSAVSFRSRGRGAAKPSGALDGVGGVGGGGNPSPPPDVGGTAGGGGMPTTTARAMWSTKALHPKAPPPSVATTMVATPAPRHLVPHEALPPRCPPPPMPIRRFVNPLLGVFEGTEGAVLRRKSPSFSSRVPRRQRRFPPRDTPPADQYIPIPPWRRARGRDAQSSVYALHHWMGGNKMA